MTEWCIVAIPEEDDRVWKYSSEKIPHVTLLYLGEQDDPEKAIAITEQVRHTINTTLSSFSMEVHSRGVLGDKSADVLFFDQALVPKQLVEFRSQLLKDDTIRRAYDSADQFPSWTPHLTMGYPTKPAKKPKDVFGSDKIRIVYFDRIALWIADYDGPTFTLNFRNSFGVEDADVMPSLAMSDQTKEFLMPRPEPTTYSPSYLRVPSPSNLKHHGIGARSHDYRNPIQSALKAAAKATLPTTAMISDDIRYLKHANEGGLLNSRSPVREQYIRENQIALEKSLRHAVGGRPSETANIRYDVCSHPNGDWLVSSIDNLAHTGTVETLVRPITDDRGMIVDYTVLPGDVPQGDLGYAIKHYGIKGMKWGVRRKSTDAAGGGDDIPKTPRQLKKEEKKAAVKKGLRETFQRPVSEDAAAAAAARSRVGKHGTDAMSNKELQALVTRMNLEQQYSNLKDNEKASKGRNAGRAYVADILKDVGRDMASDAVKEGLRYAFGQGQEAARNSRTARAERVPQFALPAPPLAIESPRRR